MTLVLPFLLCPSASSQVHTSSLITVVVYMCMLIHVCTCVQGGPLGIGQPIIRAHLWRKLILSQQPLPITLRQGVSLGNFFHSGCHVHWYCHYEGHIQVIMFLKFPGCSFPVISKDTSSQQALWPPGLQNLPVLLPQYSFRLGCKAFIVDLPVGVRHSPATCFLHFAQLQISVKSLYLLWGEVSLMLSCIFHGYTHFPDNRVDGFRKVTVVGSPRTSLSRHGSWLDVEHQTWLPTAELA